MASAQQASPATARKFTAAEQAARCAEPDRMFPQGVYRPLPTFATTRKGPGKGILTLDIEARLENDVRIGNYRVDGVPAWRIAPPPGSAQVAHLYDPASGHRCVYSRDQLTSDARLASLFIYSGYRLALQHRDTLKTNVRSAIDFAAAPASRPDKAPNGGVPCQATNQHTHGLLVNAINPDKSRGDYVFDLAMPNGLAKADQCDGAATGAPAQGYETLSHEIRIPSKPGNKDQALASGYHPSGLFWYHPHGHGYSAYQVRGATSGLITIGGVAGDTGVKAAPAPGATNIRHMILRDAQITAKPQDPAAPYQFMPNYDTALCGDFSNGLPVGFAAGEGECASPDGKSKWIFTINGAQYPRIAQDVQANETELWRIANASANVSYLLRLYPKRQGQVVMDKCQTKAFQIAEIDGVAATPVQGPQSDCPGGAPIHQALMMPGSRISIALAPSPGETYVLYSELVETGGDQWPPVKLAEVQWPAVRTASFASTSSQGAAPALKTAAPRVVHAPPVQASSRKPANICDLPPGWERVLLFVKREVPKGRKEVFGLIAGMRPAGESDLARGVWFRMAGSVAHAHHASAAGTGSALPAFDSRQFEEIAFAEIETIFSKPVASDQDLSPAFGQAPHFSQICARFGAKETWVIENWTNEIHNFHLHQAKFAVSRNRTAPYFNLPGAPFDPSKASATQIALAQFYEETKDSHHDSVPLAAGGAACVGAPRKGGQDVNCQPARVSIEVRFDRQEQVGRYPYHCHILEHEDLGMMGEVRVLGAKEPDRPGAP